MFGTLAASAVAAIISMAPAVPSQADNFKEFSSASVVDQHVTRVQVKEEMNNILDTASVYTDLKGGLLSEDAGTARLIALEFSEWKHSDNGLVTVYGSNGKMITNGNF